MTTNSSPIIHHSSLPFYVVGGTVQRDAPCYVQRQADGDLYEGLKQGQFCYVLTSRQMGKSSLMVRTATRLREEGVGVAVLDVTAIGQNLNAEQWYDGLLTQMAQQLDLEDELEEFWAAHPKLGPLQRWMQAIRQVILPRYTGRVVIFTDEIDAVRSLPFSTDEFFAAIREFYNRRTEDAELERLTFCLLGVATPSDLIRDTRTTPFNIGRRIELTDFTESEAAPLVQGLEREEKAGRELLKRALYWTGGHPYLTQRLCQAISEDANVRDAKGVDRLCEALFLSHRAQERDDNLLFVRERILRSETDLAGLLTLYGQVRGGRRVADEVTNPLVSVLRLSGITRVEGSYLRVRNRIYEQVFNQAWVMANMPDAEVRRQRVAYRRGMLRAAGVAAVVLAMVSGLAVYAFQSRQQAIAQQRIAEQQSNRADRNLHLANLSAEKAQTALASEAEQRRRAEDQQQLAEQRQTEAQEQRRQAMAETTVAEEQRGRAEQQEEANRRLLYVSNISVAQQDWEDANIGRMTELLNAQLPRPGQEDLRGFEWYYLWRLPNRELFTLPYVKLPFENVRAVVAFSPDGKKLVTTSRDPEGIVGKMSGTVKMSDAATGQGLPITFKVHTDNVISVAFSPDGKRLVTVSHDPTGIGGKMISTVKLWDAATGQELPFTLKGHTGNVQSVAFSPDGKRLATVSVEQGGASGEAKLWDAATGQELLTLNGHPSVITQVAFSPDGQRLVSGTVDAKVKLWDTASGQELLTLTGHRGPITSVAFSSDGKRLASGSWDQTARLWDVATGQELLSLKGHEGRVWSVAFSPDGKRLASGSDDQTVKLWDAATGQELTSLKGHSGGVRSVVFSPDGKRLATGSQDPAVGGGSITTVKLWDAAAGQRLLILKGHTDTVVSVAFSPDGKQLASGSRDQTVKLWDVPAGQERLTLKGHADTVNTVAFSPDGQRLASGSMDKTVKLWDVATGQELLSLKGHTSYITSVAFSPDGKRLASGSWDQTVKLWDAATGRELLALTGHTSSVLSVAFSSDGKRLATGSSDGIVKLWDAATGQEWLSLLGPRGLWSIAFSLDGKRLASGGRDGIVKLWDVATGQELRTLRGHAGQVNSVTFSPDGKRLATGGSDRTVKLWDVATGQELLTLKGHTNTVNIVAFSPDGKQLASGSHETVKLWEAATEQEVLARSQQQAPR